MKFKRALKKLFAGSYRQHESDKTLIAIVGAILLFGLVGLSSASAVVAYDKFGDAYYYFKHQLPGIVLGLIAFLVLAKIDYRIWQRYAFGFLIFSIALLLLVFIPGLSANWGQARSWIDIFGFSLQPSEFVKLSFLIYLSAWLVVRKKDLHDVELGVGPFVVILGIIGGLMILQPDIGTLSIVALSSLLVYFVGGGHYKHILFIILAGFILLVILLQLKPYQMDRVKCMIDPAYDPDKVCYQVNQSLIAVGSGGLWGRGIGESRQKFLYLPEVTGDSIFAVIAEEVGLIFSVLLVLAYTAIFYRGYLIARRAPDEFGRNLAIGISAWLTLQAFINIGGIINLIPMTGVPLPFVSLGGSSILASLAAVGLLVNISKQTKQTS